MSSFATDVIVAQNPLCERDTIKRAVENLSQALRKSAAAGRGKVDGIRGSTALIGVQESKI